MGVIDAATISRFSASGLRWLRHFVFRVRVRQRIHAWASSPSRGQPHYFRIHSPTALIEYDNTQDFAYHVQSVGIDLVDVFDRDLLKASYQCR